MTGTIVNAAGILLFGLFALTIARQPSAAAQIVLQGVLGVLTVMVGLKLSWATLSGGFWLIAKDITIVILALTLGRMTGRLLHIQKGLNHLGAYARDKFNRKGASQATRFDDGFMTGTLLFCLSPMAVLGALQDGLSGQWHTLAIKAVLDGLATLAFVATFGWGVLLSVIPLVAFQGSIALCGRLLAPFLRDHTLLDPVCATNGLLIFSVALIILQLKKIELADYYPSLIYAALLAWIWR